MPKVAFVTGSSSGIGAATVKKLASMGYIVAGFDMSAAGAEGCAQAYEGDVCDGSAIQAAVDDVVAKHGRLNCVVPCAGVVTRKALAEMSEAEIDRILDINVKGAILTCQKTIPHIEKGGSIVLVGSSSTHNPSVGLSIYCASKGAIEGLARALALDLGPDIRVNALAPGLTQTPIWTTAGMSDRDFAKLVELRASDYPLGRVGVPEDIASAIAFLASSEASWITGVHLPVDGGTHIVGAGRPIKLS